jgi:hypothetical protein
MHSIGCVAGMLQGFQPPVRLADCQPVTVTILLVLPAGLLGFLHLLASHPWQAAPLLVDPSGEVTQEQKQALQVQARGGMIAWVDLCAPLKCAEVTAQGPCLLLPVPACYIYPALVDNQVTMRRVRSCCCRLSMSQCGKQVLRQPCSSLHRMTCTQADGEHALWHCCGCACC